MGEESKKAGRSYKLRYRCPFCGMIVPRLDRFTWNHKIQAWRVYYGGREKGTKKGIIVYEPIEDDEYIRVISAQAAKLIKLSRLISETGEDDKKQKKPRRAR